MLKQLITQLADRAEQFSIKQEDCLRFVQHNCEYRPGTEFYIVFLLQAELADRSARREGFNGQADRAAAKAFGKSG